MSAKEVGEGLVAMCKQGQWNEAAEKYYAPNIVSVEADGDDREVQGMDAIRGKIEWFDNTFEVLNGTVGGPWVNEPCFITKYDIEVKNKQTGEVSQMSEYAVYTVENGKIVHERFF